MSCCSSKTSIYELCEKCAKELLAGGSALSEASTPDFPVVEFSPLIRCECGADKTGGPGHSHWCPKSEEAYGTD